MTCQHVYTSFDPEFELGFVLRNPYATFEDGYMVNVNTCTPYYGAGYEDIRAYLFRTSLYFYFSRLLFVCVLYLLSLSHLFTLSLSPSHSPTHLLSLSFSLSLSHLSLHNSLSFSFFLSLSLPLFLFFITATYQCSGTTDTNAALPESMKKGTYSSASPYKIIPKSHDCPCVPPKDGGGGYRSLSAVDDPEWAKRLLM